MNEEQDRVEAIPQLNVKFDVHFRKEEANSIKTSKYTTLNFIPKNLFEQFRRLANVYFLILSGLMMIGTYAPKTFDSPLTPYSTFFPLCVVLLFTMVKEAYEDYKRHQSDMHTNNRAARRRILNNESFVNIDLENQLMNNSSFSSLPNLDNNNDEINIDGMITKIIHWKDIRVGHVIRICNKEAIPADVVVLNTSEPEGICYVETSNIDGETNLKMKRSVVGLKNWKENLEKIVAEAPNGNVHNFNGFLKSSNNDDVLPIDANSFLLRGSSIQNCRWVDGLVVYIGKDSKLAKNASKPRLKLSSVEKTMNRLIQMIFIWLFAMVAFSVVLKVSLHDSTFSYLKKSGVEFSFPTPIAYFFTFLILFNNALPMSLYVTVEMVNFGQAYFIDHDIEMYDKESNTPARAVTSNLNSDLGQVEFLFSDKTGTLTRNVMTLKRCSVGGVLYGSPLTEEVESENDSQESNGEETEGKKYMDLMDLGKNESKIADLFVSCLSVAHTVQLEEDGSYRAESPDEKALCEGGRDLGKVFIARSGPDAVLRNNHGTEKEDIWNVLAVNDFSSARKRMSVLVKHDGKYILFCKGADTVMFPRSDVDEANKKILDQHLSCFANEGLRTLVLAIRELTSQEAETWLKEYQQAKASVEDRDKNLESVSEKIEKNLFILGATAIEDRLQDGVPETLESLRNAGIKIWVLTGDKLETAINIGFSSRLLDSTMRLVRIEGKTHQDVKSQLENVVSSLLGTSENKGTSTSIFARIAKTRFARAARWWKSNKDLKQQREPLLDTQNNSSTEIDDDEAIALAITGQALEFALEDNELKNSLLTLALSCRAVIACRVSPAQKAQMVRLIKRGAQSHGLSPVTLAIGDGANDVAMIQEAQVGVGISGKEGLQAVNASDFAISQFRFLKRLLLVHGRWSYRRMAKVILYSLYKNLVLVLMLFYFQFYSAFSGISLFESMVQAGFNFFLGMCPLAVGLFDREISARFALQNPQLYVSGRRNLNLNLIKLGWRVFEAFVHSAILFWLPIHVAQTNGFAVPAQCNTLKAQSHQAYGGTPDLYVFGLTSYTCLIFVMQYKILFEASSFTKYNGYAWIFSFALYFVFLLVYSSWHWEAPEFYWVAFCALGRPVLWWLIFLCVTSCFVFDTAVRLTRLMFRPHPVDILIERDRLALKIMRQHEKRKKWRQQGRLVAEDISFVNGEGGGFTERVKTAFDLNHRELFQRVQSLTIADLDQLGIDSPSLRSSFDFSGLDRLRGSENNRL